MPTYDATDPQPFSLQPQENDAMARHYDRWSAVFSKCGLFRYELLRTVRDASGPMVMVMGNNPSKAGASTDDQTIRRLRQLCPSNGFRGFGMYNAGALISTDPAGMLTAKDPVGPDNRAMLETAIYDYEAVIIAWGGIKGPLQAEKEWFLDLARVHQRRLLCFGFTGDHEPRHPSRLPRTARLEAFS